MNQIRFRQIARLEKRAVPHIKQREGMAQQLQNLHRGAVAHAAVLAFVLRYMEIRKSANHCRRRVDESLSLEHGRPAVRNFQLPQTIAIATKVRFIATKVCSNLTIAIGCFCLAIRFAMFSCLHSPEPMKKIN